MVASVASAEDGVRERGGLPRTRATRWGAWLLALSPAYFVAVIVANLVVLIPAGIGPFGLITRAQMDAMGIGWTMINIFFPLALILGCLGTLLLAGSLTSRPGITRMSAWGSIATAGASILLYLPYLPFRVAAAGFTEPTLGDNRWYTFWDPFGFAGADLAIVALLLLCVAMWTGTRHRTAALVIGALTLVYLVATLLNLLLPPFVISFLWCALGIVWLRRMRANTRRA